MDNGFVGNLEQAPRNYRCYILFLRNDTDLDGPAEIYVMREFWNVANSVGNDVLFTGVARGKGLLESRKKFGLETSQSSVIVLLDVPPDEWKQDQDPLVIIPLDKLKTEFAVLELLHMIVGATKKDNFIGKVKRKQTFDKLKEYLSYLKELGDLIKFIVPAA